jgi:hypothetical protein
VVDGPWFAFTDSSSRRHYCQPDFLLFDEANSFGVVVEVKTRWTDAAWWQLEKLYVPVLQRVFPHLSLLRLCICRSFDPSIPLPEGAVHFCSDLMDAKPSLFNVLVVR